MISWLYSLCAERPVLVALVAVLLSVYLLKWIMGLDRRLVPSGPYGLPVLGYLPYLGENEHLQLTSLRKKYGNIFSLRLGIRYTVVMSDFKAIKEAFNKDEISDRPPFVFKISEHAKHLGDLDRQGWKESRRFTLTSLRNLGMGKNKVEEAVMNEIDILVKKLRERAEESETDIHSLIYPAINSIIISLICGRTVKEDPAFSKILDTFSKDVLEYMTENCLGFYLPVLRPFLSLIYPKRKQLKSTIDVMEHIMKKEIDNHEKDQEDSPPQDYMDYFIAEKNKGRGSTFTDGILNGNSLIILMAGNDTTSSSIEWTLLLLAKHPVIQEKVYQEIIQVIGKERPPSWNDKEDLPYLDAVIAEVWRTKTLVPLSDLHWASEDTTVSGYHIPKNSLVISNLHAVHTDPDMWDKPEEFNPDRFITPDGKRAKDPEFLIPFGIGKRFCPGEKLGRVEVFLFLGAILQNFKILPPPGGVVMEEKADIVLHPLRPYVTIQARE